MFLVLLYVLSYVPSSFAVILMGKRELVALLSLSSLCLVIVVWLFLAVPWVSLQFVIVVFPDHTHLLLLLRVHIPKNDFLISQPKIMLWVLKRNLTTRRFF